MPSPSRKLCVPHDVADLVRGLHPQLKKKIKAGLRLIVEEPDAGKPLRAELAGLRSLRVSRFRIVYRMAARSRNIEIVAIGPRERIYEETFRLIQREQRG
jgi:mRNA interferase RelE/StbE